MRKELKKMIMKILNMLYNGKVMGSSDGLTPLLVKRLRTQYDRKIVIVHYILLNKLISNRKLYIA